MREIYKAKKAIEEVDNALDDKFSVLELPRKTMQEFSRTLLKFGKNLY